MAGAQRSCLSSVSSPTAGGSCSHRAVTLRAAQEETTLLCGTPVAHIAVLAFWKMMATPKHPREQIHGSQAPQWATHSALCRVYVHNCL